ncbi:hypothetical protein [Halovivax sp.]|uniref:hypothetical protein n=1 Tax=Halovivax sp. TaxID=1935978 RepID=UPI0025B96E35|nr:hypothetical protein [Halovivax sp.]
MRRRTLLSGIAGTTAVAVAGCIGGEESGGDETEPGEYEEPEIETVDQEQLDGADGDDERHVETAATVVVDDDRIEIEGQLEASTPCHEAVVTDVDGDGDTLTVTVEVEDAAGEDEMCTQVISEIEYEATIAFEDGAPETVVVVHQDRAGEETATEYDV